MKGSIRKRCLKRTLALVSTLAMMGSFSNVIGASEILSYNIISAAATDNGENESQPQEGTENTGKYSRIDIEISNQFEFKKSVDCTVNVFSSDGSPVLSDKTVTVGKEKNSTATINTPYLENGEYKVEISAPGFTTFSQTISDFDNMVCTVKVTLGFNNIFTYVDTYKTDENGDIIIKEDGLPVIDKPQGDHPGVMLVGDVNGNGYVDDRDTELLLAAIDSSVRNNGKINVELKEGDFALNSDLNYDGKTNLADLTFFTKGYINTRNWDENDLLTKKRNTEASLIKEISDEFKTATLKSSQPLENTSTNGITLADLVKKSGEDDKNSEENATKLELGAYEIVKDENGNEVIGEDGKPVTKEVEISEEHPVGVSIDLNNAPLKEMSFETNAARGSILVQLSDDDEPIEFKFGDNDNDAHAIGEEELKSAENGEGFPATDILEGIAAESEVKVKIDENGNISLDLGNQVAVKKITLKITKVKNTNLAEIGTVEFLNGMEERISEPEVDFPTNVKVEQDCNVRDKDAKIVATWEKPINSGTQFEFEVSTSSATKADGSFASTISGVQNTIVEEPTFTLQSEHGNFKLIKINTTYYVHVRCIEDGYKSKWSDFAKVTTVSNSKPDKPDYVNAKGDFRSMKVTWGSDNTNSTTGYKLYYRNINNADGSVNTEPYKEVNVGKTTSYTIYGLEDKQEYEVYVIGTNSKGDSPESVHAKGKTTSVDPVIFPKYNAINCDDKGVLGSAHILSVTREEGEIVGENEKDAATAASGKGTAWSVVDNDQETYYTKKNSWGDKGLIFEFDKEYDIGSFALTVPVKADICYVYAAVWNEETEQWDQVVTKYFSNAKKNDKNGKTYLLKEFPHFKGKKVKIWFDNWREAGNNEVTYSEIVFYQYESLMDDIMNLYADDLHTVLKDNVTQATIEELRKKIVLPSNGEFHPNKERLERELNTAEKILNAENITPPVLVHNSITTYDPTGGKSRKYSGLNAWQPLGVNAGANTEVTIYVGGKNTGTNYTMKTDESTELKLIATQYNSESNGVTLLTKDLKIGANTITIPSGSIANAEAGGALYVQHHGGDQSKVYYSVRVEGGTQVPILDLYKITDREERLNKAADYIEALEAYVKNMEAEHNKVHKGSKYNDERNTSLDYDYNKALCIAGATDILCDTMMYSLPAPQILAGLGNGSFEARAEKLVQSMDSMEEMMKLFYQHKGMSADATDVVDRIPNQHLNIRYQRMFQGASMYAAVNHIGIQWGSASGMVSSTGVKSDQYGRYVSGSYFGWGIAHEIGHNLNDASYTVAEITNNYFSLLSQSQDKNEGSRLNYNNIYKKVTSNTRGQADQGTQLGMYWQLHLAYDKDFNYKTYDTNEEILENLFYARMDTYSRNPAKAPQPYGTALTLSGGTDQQLMRLACAAAEKDVLEFFERWGKTPDKTTLTYASQFPKETRAIMYANEDSRVYAMEGESWLVNDDGTPTAVINDVKVNVGTGAKANKVNISIDVSDEMYADDILGYEIVRCTISGGDVKETPIAFTKTPNYTDTVTSFNNRTVSYKVTVIDHYLNRSAVFSTDMVKIEHDGSLEKSNWTITADNNKLSNTRFDSDIITHDATDNELLPCEATVIDPVMNAFDNDLTTFYEATVNESPSIYINFNEPQVVCGIKITTPEEYKADAIQDCWVYIKDETGKWVLALPNNKITKLNKDGIIYFSNSDQKYISTFETSEIRVQILNKKGKKVYISEIDVLGVTGDNVDFRRDGEKGATAFGILSEDYKYGTKENDFIPKDSVVFIGSYKGNPAYNAVILFDENGNIVGGNGVNDDGKAQQIILADVPDGSLITNVSNGTFVYWINPDDIDNMLWPEQVRVELYRVNNAQTNEGQRIVSDSLFETVPAKDEMPSITIGGNRKYTTEDTTEVGDTE
ncbi:MAG: M60 family metallopeptidase [Ruminococcus sp.]|nr:M60 family metallopeptidase [Ruminococcus sp.]